MWFLAWKQWHLVTKLAVLIMFTKQGPPFKYFSCQASQRAALEIIKSYYFLQRGNHMQRWYFRDWGQSWVETIGTYRHYGASSWTVKSSKSELSNSQSTDWYQPQPVKSQATDVREAAYARVWDLGIVWNHPHSSPTQSMEKLSFLESDFYCKKGWGTTALSKSMYYCIWAYSITGAFW